MNQSLIDKPLSSLYYKTSKKISKEVDEIMISFKRVDLINSKIDQIETKAELLHQKFDYLLSLNQSLHDTLTQIKKETTLTDDFDNLQQGMKALDSIDKLKEKMLIINEKVNNRQQTPKLITEFPILHIENKSSNLNSTINHQTFSVSPALNFKDDPAKNLNSKVIIPFKINTNFFDAIPKMQRRNNEQATSPKESEMSINTSYNRFTGTYPSESTITANQFTNDEKIEIITLDNESPTYDNLNYDMNESFDNINDPVWFTLNLIMLN